MKGSKLNAKGLLLINVVLAQGLIVTINGMWGYYATSLPIDISMGYITAFSMIFGAILVVAAILLIKEIYQLAEKEAEVEVSNARLQENLELIEMLKSHRHDFMNHIQVVYGLAQLGKIDNLAFYVGEVTQELETESKLSKLAHPELAVFLIKKTSKAAEQGVRLRVDSNTDLIELDIPPTDIVRIVGNIVDNAVYAAGESDESHKEVFLSLTEDDGNYQITVHNNGPHIPDSLKKKIFEKGFTTKGPRGNGLGLHIISTLVKKYGGKVSLVNSLQCNTCFEIILPKVHIADNA